MIKKALLLLFMVVMIPCALYAGDFIDNKDGTVTDGDTGLMWQKKDTQWVWASASIYCATRLDLGGYEDWRLPSLPELATITEQGRYNPAIETEFFPLTRSAFYWSANVGISVSDDDAWGIDFYNAEVEYARQGEHNYVRCVRGTSKRRLPWPY